MSTARDPIRVLYVDSDPEVAGAAATYLERLNDRLDVVTASEAREGREQLTEGEFDCVVSQYELRDQDGTEFLEQLRAAHPDLPLFLVGDTRRNGASVAEATAAGVTDSVQGRAGTAQYDRLASLIVDAVPQHGTEPTGDRTEQHLREFAESTDSVFWIVDPEWTSLEFVNPAYEAVYGQPRETLRNRPRDLLEAVHPDDRDRVEEAMQRAGDGESVTISHRVDGTTEYDRWVRVWTEPITDGDGAVVRVVWCAREITGQKEREQELKRQNERLSDFASVVSHDLRNPLNVAEGRLELARTEVDSDHLDAVSRAHDRMETLIDDILTLARQGESVTETRTVDLAGTAEQCWPSAERGAASLVVETDQSIRADEGRLQQLIGNLVHNAIEHGAEDVTVTVGALEDGFYVADDGPGIAEDRRDQVFESGYSTGDHGTGFGLSIVEEIADAHGWELAVTDSEDGGARFEITGVDVVQSGESGAEGGSADSPTEHES